MEKRVQSPSSIKVFKQCPRKYYYQYIRKLETLPSIHTLRGNIVHEILDEFFNLDISILDHADYKDKLRKHVQELLVDKWKENEYEFISLGISKQDNMFYFDETMVMLLGWIDNFIKKIQDQKCDVKTAFKKLSPIIREQEHISLNYFVKGIIDVIYEIEGKTHILDYKTNKNINIDEHKLQLAIYSLLYHEKHGKLPDKVGINFLKGGEIFLNADNDLLNLAKKEIELIHQNTQSKEIKDYNKHITNLCKWSTGQCDFYDTCKNE